MPGTTPNRGYPYPEYDDPQDVRQNIQDLATAVDTDMDLLHNAISLSINSPSVSLFNTTAQPIAAGVQTTLTWSTQSYDSDAMWDPAPDPTIITFQTSGIYLLTCMVGFAATADATPRDAVAEIMTSGLPSPVVSKSLLMDQTTTTYFALAVPYPATAGDTAHVRVRHDGVAAINVTDTRFNVSRFARLSPL
jgi:hypothetical protein